MTNMKFKIIINEVEEKLTNNSSAVLEIEAYTNGKISIPNKKVFDQIPSQYKKADSEYIFKKIIISEASEKKLNNGKEISLKHSDYMSWTTSLKSATEFKSKFANKGAEIIIKKKLDQKYIAVNINLLFDDLKMVNFYKNENELIMEGTNYLLSFNREEIVIV